MSLCVSETLNGERDTFAKNVATFRRSDPLEESIDDRRDRPMIDRRWIEDLTLGLIRKGSKISFKRQRTVDMGYRWFICQQYAR